jgi:hypothetical protein
MTNSFRTAPVKALALATALALPATPSLAQSAAVPNGPTEFETAGEPKRFPAIFGSASAFPSPGGTGYVGLTAIYPRGGIYDEDEAGILRADGDFGFGYTLGNPIDSLSATFNVALTSLTPFGDSGAVGIDLSRALFVGDTALTFAGVSVNNIVTWGDATVSPTSYTVYVSHLFSLQSSGNETPIQLTLGYGDQTTYLNDFLDIGEGVFWGVGVGLSRNLSVSLSGTRNELHVGMGFGIDSLPNWSFAAGVYDLQDHFDNRQFAVSVSRGF